MNQLLGELLPMTVGIALSPLPIIAVILMLMSPRAGSTSVGFLAGWCVGIALCVSVMIVLSGSLPDDDGGAEPVAGMISIALGLLAIMVALRQWRARPAPGVDAELPTWMAAIDKMTALRATGLGITLSALNPKTLVIALGVGVTIGTSEVSRGDKVAAVLAFTALAASTVAAPVVANALAARRMADTLDSMRSWLVHNNATVMAVVMLVMGLGMVGKGIGKF